MAKQEISYDIKLLLVLVLLFVLYPIGLIFMFKWMKWPTWVKLIIAFPVLLIILGFMAVFIIGFRGSYNPKTQVETAEELFNNAINENTCTKQCATLNTDVDTCVQKCIQNLNTVK